MTVFVRDPCGIVCILMTYVAVLYADYVVVRWIILQTMQNSLWGPFHVVLFNTIVFLLGMAHLKAVCSDPGVVPLPQNRVDFSDIHSGSQNSLQREDWTVCTRCETYRPPRAHHCRICKRCIRRMDHHCPWINNCVGEQNQKYFIQFLVYVGALAAYAIILVIVSWVMDCPECSNEVTVKQSRMCKCSGKQIFTLSWWVYCQITFERSPAVLSLLFIAIPFTICCYIIPYLVGSILFMVAHNVLFISGNDLHEWRKNPCGSDITLNLHCVILVVESALFGMFVSAILVDQFQAIFSDETAVEQVQQQGPYRPHKHKWALLTEVCGRSHPIFWLLPCASVPKHLEEPLLNHTV